VTWRSQPRVGAGTVLDAEARGKVTGVITGSVGVAGGSWLHFRASS